MRWLTTQRNLSISHIAGDIAFFFDDDTVLGRNYMESCVEVLAAGDHVAGVQGTMIDGSIAATRHRATQWLQRIFLVQSLADGRVHCSGYPAKLRDPRVVSRVEWLSGGLCCYRTALLQAEHWDENIPSPGCEDNEFSYRVSRKYALCEIPEARIEHRHTPAGRRRPTSQIARRLFSHYYFAQKHYSQSPWNWLPVLWAGIGLSLGSFGKFGVCLDSLVGVAKGHQLALACLFGKVPTLADWDRI